MGWFEFFKAKKQKDAIQSNKTSSHNTTSPFPNEDADIIMGRKLHSADSLLFYRKQWDGKGDSGVDWMIVKYGVEKFHILYKSAHANYGESLPSFDNIKLNKHSKIPLQEINTYQNYQKILDFIQTEFSVSLSIDDCITEEEYSSWIEKFRVISLITERVYKFNNGYADRACCLCYNSQEYYFYLKETGNNKGYSLGQKVYEFGRDSYLQFKNELFDRETLSKYVCDLPHGDQNWLDDEAFIKTLISYVTRFS